jgi:ATP-binding cassette subfamily B protein
MSTTTLSDDRTARRGRSPHAVRAGLARLRGRLGRRERVPVLLQSDATECGAACLAMILSYFGRQTPVAACRARCGVGRDGLTARVVADAGRQFGLRVRALSLEPSDLPQVPLPAIAHWQFNHFIVVERWSPDGVDIVDPAFGRRRLTAAEFDLGFTGVLLTLEPGVDFERRASAGPAWLGYLASAARLPDVAPGLLQIVIASAILQLLGLTLPFLTEMLVDDILPLRDADLLLVVGVGLAIIFAAQVITGYLRAAVLLYLRARLDTRLMLGFFEHVLALPYAFFQQRTTGDLIGRLTSNMVIRETLTSQTMSVALDGLLVVLYLALLLLRDWQLGALALGIGLLQGLVLVVTARPMHRLTQSDLVADAESRGYLVEAIKGISTLKASGTEHRALEHWSGLFFEQLNLSMRRGQLEAVVDTVLATLRTVAPLLLLWFGAHRVIDGALSLGEMLGLNALAVAFLTPLASLVASGRQLQLVKAHLDRLTDVLEAETEQDSQAARTVPPLAGRIEVRDVSFRYHPNAPLSLREVSLTVEPGQKVALVGRTGSGKSTLAMLLLGLYRPTAGAILIDGMPLESLEYRSLRSRFGLVLQESFLFRGSIRQNIGFAAPDLPLDRIVEAARLATLDDDVEAMPMGYETLVGEGGAGLSGGQRQRLALARALAQRPSILLLDEATSALDVLTESIVDRHLSDLSCTRIVIAHRLSTIRNADLILVLDGGQIVERGTHNELLALGGQYAALVRHQVTDDGAPEPGTVD